MDNARTKLEPGIVSVGYLFWGSTWCCVGLIAIYKFSAITHWHKILNALAIPRQSVRRSTRPTRSNHSIASYAKLQDRERYSLPRNQHWKSCISLLWMHRRNGLCRLETGSLHSIGLLFYLVSEWLLTCNCHGRLHRTIHSLDNAGW